MKDCIFCKIINGEVPATKVYEDDEILAFEDIDPAAPIHVLIIPKKHIETLVDLEQEDSNLMGNLLISVKKVAEKLGVSKNGFRLIANCGQDGGQEVMHIHFHLLAGIKLGPKIVS